MTVPAVVQQIDHGLSVGAIPGRGVRDAFQPILAAIRGGPAKYYIRSDIEGFFANMPRSAALQRLAALLPDRSLDAFLEDATRTELRNHQELGHLLDFFPDQFTGVPQGHALSALLGNLLLRPLDQALNEGGVLGVRYLDDFIVLGPDKSSTWAGFRRARNTLASIDLQCYPPGTSNKAKEGSTQKMFEFLGCEVTPSFVRPSGSNRSKLLAEVKTRLERSAAAMRAGECTDSEGYRWSVATTLVSVSRLLRGWSEQYSFCNYGSLQLQMDAEVDRMLRQYLGTYADARDNASDLVRRRMVGVWRLTDAHCRPLIADPHAPAGAAS
jgi:hypothetical protein